MEPTSFRSDNVSSLLDLIFTNEENMVLNLSTLPGLGKSDHVILNINLNCSIISSKESILSLRKTE